MRTINTVGVWPVAFTGAARWAGPICENGHVIGFHTNWKPFRTFPVDMSAFAVSLKKLLVERPEARFDPDIKPGFLETSFLEQITTMDELEPKASNCMKVCSQCNKPARPLRFSHESYGDVRSFREIQSNPVTEGAIESVSSIKRVEFRENIKALAFFLQRQS